jgi:protein gp37
MAPPATDDPRDRRIFAGSMADMFGRWVPAAWIEAVFAVMRQAQPWEFLALTKFPQRLAEFEIPENLWVGTSVDVQARVKNAEDAMTRVRTKVRFLSVEPMLERLTFARLDLFHLVIVGGASPSSRTPRWIPPYEWRDHLARQADAAGAALYEKSNLLRKEEPQGARYAGGARPAVFDYLGKGRSRLPPPQPGPARRKHPPPRADFSLRGCDD